MFKAENKNGLLKIPHLDRVSENFVSHSVFGDKFGKIAFPWENFVGTFGVCECKSETCLDWPPDETEEINNPDGYDGFDDGDIRRLEECSDSLI
jgi:hypothetical protein